MSQEKTMSHLPKLTKKLRDYKCVECENIDEYIHDDMLADCSKCGFVSKLTSSYCRNKPIFKGKGFYETDYKEKE